MNTRALDRFPSGSGAEGGRRAGRATLTGPAHSSGASHNVEWLRSRHCVEQITITEGWAVT